MTSQTDISKALEAYLVRNNMPVNGEAHGEYSFLIEIQARKFNELKAGDVFAETVETDAIDETITIDCYALTHNSDNALMPPGTLAFFAELPIGRFSQADYYMVLSVINEFNSDGILSGGLFVDQGEQTVFYRHATRLVDSGCAHEAIDDFFERSVNELVYSIQGFRIFERKLKDVNEKAREERKGKVITLFANNR